jgi:hypothetical protein
MDAIKRLPLDLLLLLGFYCAFANRALLKHGHAMGRSGELNSERAFFKR